MTLSSLSGVVINRNGPATGTVGLDTIRYSQFTLPEDYLRGESTMLAPPLTGFQVFVNIDPGQQATATLTWELDQLSGDSWSTLASGSSTGAAQDGAVWFNAYFSKPLPVMAAWLDSTLRLGVQGSGGLSTASIS